MSPTRALESPVFLFYLSLVVGLLVVSGCVLALFHWGLRKNVGHAWAAYRGWLIMVPILLLVYFIGREACILFATVLASLGFHEFARASGLYQDGLLAGTVFAGIAGLGIACEVPDPANGAPGWYDLFMALPVVGSAVILAIPVARNRTQGQLRMVGM